MSGSTSEWVYPWRFDLSSAYYDIAVMELGKRPVLLFHHIWFVTFQCYILVTYQLSVFVQTARLNLVFL